MPRNLATVLEEIVATRRTHLPAIREQVGHVDPDTLPASQRSLRAALEGSNRFIMECKSSSPSLGLIRDSYRPGELARIYSRYAAAISVLCEPERFGGSYEHLATVSASTHLPVLCKDFIVDPIQITAARYYGADAVLLMLSVLDDATYLRLRRLADALGMDVLTEAATEEEVDRAIRLDAPIIGINNRDLHDLSIDLERTARLAKGIPAGRIVVSESGIRDRQTALRLGRHANAFLVGSHLSGQSDVDRAARELVFGHHKVCGLSSAAMAQVARAHGARYGGLVLEPGSPRQVSRETAAQIAAEEPGLDFVAVTRAVDTPNLLAIAGIPGLHAVQLHAPYQGSEEAELELLNRARAVCDTADAPVRIWRAVDMAHPEGARRAQELRPHVDRLVLDTGKGGTGTAFDWHSIPEDLKHDSLLAGGLNPRNITEALDVGTLGLDLNSGLETAPGRKDAGLVAEALSLIRNHAHNHS